jgi:hypothetical protein
MHLRKEEKEGKITAVWRLLLPVRRRRANREGERG